jgi:hypothetical protein
MTTWIDRWRRWSVVSITLIGLTLLLGRGAPPAEDFTWDLDRLTSGQAFDFFTWELQALARKAVYGLLAPHRFVSDEEQSRFVLGYLDDVQEARRLADEIDRIYTDPEIDDAEAASAEAQKEFGLVRDRMAQHAPIAEMILEKQVSNILAGAGLGRARTILPPVSGTFTPLPLILIVSPRSRIESVYQQQLIAGLTAAEQSEIEDHVSQELPDYSPYVTNIGGLAAYPSMLASGEFVH